MFYIRPTLGLADSTSGGVLVVSNTETEKNRNRVLELKTEPEVAILEPNQPYHWHAPPSQASAEACLTGWPNE